MITEKFSIEPCSNPILVHLYLFSNVIARHSKRPTFHHRSPIILDL